MCAFMSGEQNKCPGGLDKHTKVIVGFVLQLKCMPINNSGNIQRRQTLIPVNLKDVYT